ncbi:unnamed protein product [Arabidopsis lyrata]|uniref:Predicted protein n=1 Tax=Arabidopsis lyrata subsp. lyrata TaxID=81972 RepID=D7LI92_ARALL|nr:predicted protein [Arabidopsis lyrata subsp. lyrata]CAH8263383.1 unnamed protein product [Arabidopsis lyrata]
MEQRAGTIKKTGQGFEGLDQLKKVEKLFHEYRNTTDDKHVLTNIIAIKLIMAYVTQHKHVSTIQQEKQKISTDSRQEITAFHAWIGLEAESRLSKGATAYNIIDFPFIATNRV